MTDKNLSLFSRAVRDNTGGLNISSDSEQDYVEGIDLKEAV
ncbi:MAG: hypothetical protein R2766_06645 [Saprospiraceae bacterium]